jgi:hypothetical protein
VPLDLAIGKTKLENATVSRIFSIGNRAVINGKAGCGKSTLMRHFFLDSIRDGKRVPIFIELNQVNDNEKVDLWGIAIRTVSKHGLKLDLEQLKRSVIDGRFTFLFDGLDEVSEGYRKSVIDQIEDIASLCDRNLIIISSRPDDVTSQLKSFNAFVVLPLSVDKAVQLVDRVVFDEDIKQKFAEALKTSLYEKHKSFLANPLLLSIMLLTYGQSASIPNKISIFFNQAFEALFQTHDTYKGGFSRKRSTNLDIQEFERAFAAFCLLSYDSSAFTFSKTECLEFMNKAKPISQIEYTSQSLLKDCLQSVCLLMNDGLKIAFVHRSFQEYFAAKCITRLDEKSKGLLLKRFGARGQTDTVLENYWELDRSSFEKSWLIPIILKIREQIGVKRKVSLPSYVKYLKLICDNIEIDPTDLAATPNVRLVSSTNPLRDEARKAIFFVHHRYWRKLAMDRGDKESRLKMQRLDSPSMIRTAMLRSNSPELTTLRSCGWVLGIDFVQFFVDLPSELNRKLASELESIESILNLQGGTRESA